MKHIKTTILAAVAAMSSVAAVASGNSRGGALDFSGCLPADRIRTIALVMPASIQSKAQFDRGKAALESAGYKVKVMPRSTRALTVLTVNAESRSSLLRSVSSRSET